MNFFELINKRHSIRAFAPKPVEKEKLQKILNAVNRAPSAGNLQAYEIFVITETRQKEAIAQAALDQAFIATAPVILVFCSHPALSSVRYGLRGERLYSFQDSTIACSFAMMAATALDLATVWIGAFKENPVRKVIDAPSAFIPTAILPIGYAGEEPTPTTRRSLDRLVHYVS